MRAFLPCLVLVPGLCGAVACGGSTVSLGSTPDPSPTSDAATDAEGCGGGLESGAPWPMFGRCPSLKGRATAVGPAAPHVKWFYAARPAGQPSIGADGTVYLATLEGTLVALDPGGVPRWTFTASPGSSFVGTPAIRADGTLLVASSGGTLLAVSPSGSLAWSFQTGVDASITSPTLGPDGTAYVSSSGTLFAVRPDGTAAWQASAGGLMPAIGPGGALYGSGSDGSLRAWSSSGQALWTASFDVSQMSIADDGTILTTAPSPSGEDAWSLVAVSPGGARLWALGLGYTWGFSPVTTSSGTVLLDTGSGLAAVSPKGKKQWVSPLTGATGGSAPVVDGSGTAYVGTFAADGPPCGLPCGDGTPTGAGLQAFRADGTSAWVFASGEAFFSPAIGADGTLYAAERSGGEASGGGVYALGR